MWEFDGKYIQPFTGQTLYSEPYQNLPKVWVQNASLEIAHTYVVYSIGNISGNKIIPFFTTGYEGYDINQKIDLEMAQNLIDKGLAKLPEIK
jgi:N-acylneuraminate cytidylyltransferase